MMLKLDDGTLVFKEDWPVLRAACVLGGLLIPAAILWGEYQSGVFRATRVAGAVLGAVLPLWIAAIISDRSFRFDARRRVLTWNQRNSFGMQGGEIPFSDIRDVLVTEERSRDDDNTVGGYTVRYSALIVTTGGNLTLTATHSSDRTDYDHTATAIRDLVRGSAVIDSGVNGTVINEDESDEVTRLVAAGQIINAVAALRKRQGMGLTEARKEVERISEILRKAKS